jgi:hypothetical protein
MAIHNSLDSREYLELYCNLYADIVDLLKIPTKESRRDLSEIRKRHSFEGVSFLTKTLPSLGKALDKAMHSDTPISVPSTFSRQKGQVTPNLFRWLFIRVFMADGHIRCDADTECIKALRQLVYFLYKLEIPHNLVQERKLLDEFVEVDATLEIGYEPDVNHMSIASRIIDAIFHEFDHRDIVPRPGPGAVATGEKQWEKHHFQRLYQSVERIYPFSEYFQFSLSAVCDRYRHYEDLELLESGTAKVVLVPKDSRGPRIISCEPLELQWIQQGLGRKISSHLESHWLTSNHVNFTDQTINQRLALTASIDQSKVTLDMKEASDRVSVKLVQQLFAGQPDLLDALMATRSTHTVLPDGRVVHMKKFAPMGSNLCFPIEAVCFYALGVAAIMCAESFKKRFTRKCGTRGPSFHEGLRYASRMVHVYGDDIIVDREFYPDLLQCFPKLKLRFNEDKCCTAGFFRESCGVDAYKGVNVTPLRLKKVWCHRTVDANVVSSYVEFSNLAYSRGFKRVAIQTARLVEQKIGPLPVVRQKQGFLAFIRPFSVSYIPNRYPRRFNKDLQRIEYRMYVSRPVQKRTGTDSWCMILRHMRESVDENHQHLPFTSMGHTPPGIFAVPRRSRLIRGWTSVF